MSDKLYLNIKGLNDVLKDLNTLSEGMKTKVAMEINASALNIQKNAKKDTPVNMGTLRNSIQLEEFIESDKILFTVGSKLSYAPYIEFGTGGKVNTQGYNDFASTFKGGKKGTFKELILALMEWVKRKGIAGTYSIKTQKRTGSKANKASQDKSLAYAIAISILKKGLRPQPYLIPAYEIEKVKLVKNIKEIIANVKS